MSTATKANSPVGLAIVSLVGTEQLLTVTPVNHTVNATEGTSY